MKDHRVSVNGVDIQVRENEVEGDTVIFLHFSGANLMMWQPAIPFFQQRFHLVLVDLRGHGKSSQPETGYNMDEMAQDIIGVMHQLRIEKAHIVGSSLGAEVGLSMAANHPNMVDSLVCEGAFYDEYGPYGIWQGTEEEFNTHVATRLEKIRNSLDTLYASIDDLVEDRRRAYEEYGIWNEYIEAMVRYGVREVEGGKFVKSWGIKASEIYTRHYYYSCFEDYYRRIYCPILMLPDEEIMNNGLQKDAMYGLQRLAVNCKISSIPGWSHPYGWLLTPEVACLTVMNFIAEAVG